MTDKSEIDDFELTPPDIGTRFPVQHNYPTLPSGVAPLFKETKCQVQKIVCTGKKYGNVILIQFVLLPDSEKFLVLNKGWDEIKELAKEYNKDVSAIRREAKKRCLEVRRRNSGSGFSAKQFVFHGIDVDFESVQSEPSLFATFDVFFYFSDTFATLTTLYIPRMDALVVTKIKYSRPNRKLKKIILSGDFRNNIFERIKKICAHRISNHEFFLRS